MKETIKKADSFLINVSMFQCFNKEACRNPFPSHCFLSGSWYVSQQRVYYHAILKHMFNVLDIKPLIIVIY